MNKALPAMTTPPVILFGHGRSGTSILASLIRDYLKIAFGTESQFIVDYYQQIHEFGSLQHDENLRRLINKILGERWFRRSRKFNDFQLTQEQIFSAVTHRSYEGILNAIFSLFADHIGMIRWGDKTPGYIDDLPVIDKLFPNAQYIYIVRDGRDVALSLDRIHFGPKNIFTAACDWRDIVRKGDAFANSLPPERLFSLTYEQLLDDPAGKLKEIGQFLYSGDLSNILADEIDKNVPAIMMRSNHSKWKELWTEPQRIAYEKIACRELRKHGYRTLVTQPAPKPNKLTCYYWAILNEFGKWRFLDYWSDNLYKIRMRLRRSTISRRKRS